MKSRIYEEQDREYFDCYIYITPFERLSTEEWRRCITLDMESGEIDEGDWTVSANQNSGFDDTDRSPPIEVMREYSRRYPEMVAAIMRERLNGTSG